MALKVLTVSSEMLSISSYFSSGPGCGERPVLAFFCRAWKDRKGCRVLLVNRKGGVYECN